MISSFSRADALRPIAERQIDEHFAEAINRIIGPMGPLHFIKRHQATTGGGPLVDDAQSVIDRAAEQDQALAELDTSRRAMKAGVRTAATSVEIKAILARMQISFPL